MFQDMLKKLRANRNITQQKLADDLNVTKGAVAMWETGKRTPDNEMLVVISKYFNVSVDYLLGVTSIQNFNLQLFSTPDVKSCEIQDAYDRASPEIQAAVRKLLDV